MVRNPQFSVIPLKHGDGSNCKINPQSPSTLPKNRTNVEVRIHMPGPHHRDGPARLRNGILFPCRRHQLTRVLIALTAAASLFGHRKLFTVKQTDFPLFPLFPLSIPSPSEG